MSKIKLVYFDVRGRAEIIRILFKVCKIEFEDVRISKEDWPTIKATTPSSQLPYLEYDGHTLTQSMAIARLFAKKQGLMGKDDIEYYRVERAIEQMNDVFHHIFTIYHSAEDKKEEMREEFVNTSGKQLLKVLEGFIKDTGLFVAETITLAEICFIVLGDYLEIYQRLLEQFPKLIELRERILKNNKDIDEWVKTRPVTE